MEPILPSPPRFFVEPEPDFQFGYLASERKLLADRFRQLIGRSDTWELIEHGIKRGWIHRPVTREIVREQQLRADAA